MNTQNRHRIITIPASCLILYQKIKNKSKVMCQAADNHDGKTQYEDLL